MEGSTDRWALLSATAHLTAGDYTLTGTDSDDYRCYLRNDSIHGDNWRPLSTMRSQPVREATLPEADYQLVVEVGDGVSQVNVDTTILPFLTQL